MGDKSRDSIGAVDSDESRKNSKNKNAVKKVKTFNRLDERFQWKPSLDDNHIFPEEIEMISKLRSIFPEIEEWSDKRVLYFLFARRHDFEATKDLLKKHIAKRKELGFDMNSPTFHHVKDAFKSQASNVVVKGAVDKHERLIVYYRIRHDLPKNLTIVQKYAILFWETFYRCDAEPIRYLRNGIIIFVDFEGFGFKNLDMSSEAKEFYNAMTGIFPRRIRQLYVVNGGAILRLALKAGKLILSKKIMKRITTLDKKMIKELIPDRWLLSEYGGSLQVTFESTIEDISKHETESSKAPSPNVNVKSSNLVTV